MVAKNKKISKSVQGNDFRICNLVCTLSFKVPIQLLCQSIISSNFIEKKENFRFSNPSISLFVLLDKQIHLTFILIYKTISKT